MLGQEVEVALYRNENFLCIAHLPLNVTDQDFKGLVTELGITERVFLMRDRKGNGCTERTNVKWILCKRVWLIVYRVFYYTNVLIFNRIHVSNKQVEVKVMVLWNILIIMRRQNKLVIFLMAKEWVPVRYTVNSSRIRFSHLNSWILAVCLSIICHLPITTSKNLTAYFL